MRLAARNDLAPEHLKGEDVLLLEDGHCLREHALSLCRLSPGRRNSDVGATSLHTLVHMVEGGMGVTLLPKLAADGGAAAGARVALRPFAKPAIGRSIGIAWREGSPREARSAAACGGGAEAVERQPRSLSRQTSIRTYPGTRALARLR